jgi:hypothetical protein
MKVTSSPKKSSGDFDSIEAIEETEKSYLLFLKFDIVPVDMRAHPAKNFSTPR